MNPDAPRDIASLLHGTPLLVMLDIDGTLCDIVPQAGDAAVPDYIQALLERLAARPGVHVALVTGRSVRDALRMVHARGVHIFGNHGIEMLHATGELEIAEGWKRAAPSLQAAAEQMLDLTRDTPGSFLEHKEFTLTVHFRHVDDDRVPALTSSVSRIAARYGLDMAEGKCVLNIVPRIAVDKGTAVLRLVHDIMEIHQAGADDGAILFAGDDVTDEDAFRALGRDVPRAVTVKIGERRGDTAARYWLPDPFAVYELLTTLDAQHT